MHVHFSGNPGYVVGLPLVSAMRTAKYPLKLLLTSGLVVSFESSIVEYLEILRREQNYDTSLQRSLLCCENTLLFSAWSASVKRGVEALLCDMMVADD